ncbi:MAG TPA: CRISPR-associated helicase Cas3' [Bryobacteraceae bacterium]|nr:CRISPR-associated helicase Cas3' [Bryobacteraceae bacterium]
MPSQTFEAFFTKATGKTPYRYQTGLAERPIESRLIRVPTGCGKTAAVILAWLWRWREYPSETPRRLVYCLPMRVLVEQTRDCALDWLNALGMLAGDVERLPAENGQRGRIVADSYRWRAASDGKVGVHMLMGGEEAEDWDVHPESAAILIGTQDMLLSRALNRGYGMSRYRWPIHFGLFHTDCLWVFDEIQLMGSGLATTSQLEAFRATAGGNGCHSWWMSATLDPTWLETVDFKERVKSLPPTKLGEADFKSEKLRDGYEARKLRSRAKSAMGDSDELAREIVKAHEERKGRTLVVVNTVKRARELHEAIRKELVKAKSSVALTLIHSQFRPPDRRKQIDRLLAEPDEHGMIVVSTQVVEAGVDVSARTLFTELAPWSSLVQRFGRCNRRGLENESARVFSIDLPNKKEEQEKLHHPYELEDLLAARKLLIDLKDVGPKSLEGVQHKQSFEHSWVIRRKDFADLFDTTPDLAGNDIDIDRYVREVEQSESDVQVFWRDWNGEPSAEMPRPSRDELCRVPIGEFRKLLEDTERRKLAYRWDYLNDEWVRAETSRVYPGQIYLLNVSAGGYASDRGWSLDIRTQVLLVSSDAAEKEEAYHDDGLSQSHWQSIAQHTDKVCTELDSILSEVSLEQCERNAIRIAARWHDWGKAHRVFQDAIDDGQVFERNRRNIQRCERPAEWQGNRFVAKAPGKKWKDGKVADRGFWRKYERKHFRHELASALAVLQRPHPDLSILGDDDLNLVAFLVAAHHGKVRLSIRSLPEERAAPHGRRFARGVWDGDELPATDLGGGVTASSVKLSLEPMEVGLCQQAPFEGQPSWVERMLRLRVELGPLRVAYLETLLRAADMRASAVKNPPEGTNA